MLKPFLTNGQAQRYYITAAASCACDRRVCLTEVRVLGRAHYYRVEIIDDMFGRMTGEFEAPNAQVAEIKARRFYAEENGTFPEEIQIKSIALGRY